MFVVYIIKQFVDDDDDDDVFREYNLIYEVLD